MNIKVKPSCNNPSTILTLPCGDVEMIFDQMFLHIHPDDRRANLYTKTRVYSFKSEKRLPFGVQSKYLDIAPCELPAYPVLDVYADADMKPICSMMKKLISKQYAQLGALMCEIDGQRYSLEDILAALSLEDPGRLENEFYVTHEESQKFVAMLGRGHGQERVVFESRRFATAAHHLQTLFPSILDIWKLPIRLSVSNKPVEHPSAREALRIERVAGAKEYFRRQGVIPQQVQESYAF